MRYPPPTADTAAGRGMNGLKHPNRRKHTNSRYGVLRADGAGSGSGARASREVKVQDQPTAEVDAVGVGHEVLDQRTRDADGGPAGRSCPPDRREALEHEVLRGADGLIDSDAPTTSTPVGSATMNSNSG